MSIQDLREQKRTSAADAVRQVRDGDFIIVPTGVGEPPTLLSALSEQRRDFHDVKVAQILAMRKYAYIVDFTNDPSLAGLNDNLVAINATLQVDLLGQCGSESLGCLP